ncbi:c-type cytochrome biogenesis protein CcsB [Mangrovactinospora gilvigrisea]|uniref:C-type cytochrome biogenesis protein CcsB n=1 Tax=Mangrovactinospora gilvigrisea TaxID=1428644 RepID=A0A1J7BJY3_9ACTN|nr:c-type cytochrome biogenesis protein CcsB [Mangrovactinospora gilvigrisea]OIV38901.1 c-type cytochrome biogenesis protein CcsB [Mangrovactinospora gilvigrisea]
MPDVVRNIQQRDGAVANETLAQLSNWLIYSAIAVYLLAFFAYCAEWVWGGRSRVAVQSAALVGAANESAEEKVLVGAGVGGSGRAGKGAAAGGGVDDAKLEALLAEESDDDGDVSGGNERADMFGRMAVSLTVLAFVLHLASVVARGMSVHRAPWGNMYEFSLAVTLVAAGVYLGFALRGKGRWLGIFMMLAVLTTLGVAVTELYTASAQLVPALHSYWLIIHVSAAIVSFGALHVGFISAVLYLFKDSREKRVAAGREGGRLGAMLDRLPSAASLDKTAYRVNAVIFPLWTFAIICGAIWAENAWGHYWQWDPKETWAFITWVAYAAYLHARSTAGWKGRRAAYISLVAFACFIFNYYLVNIFFNSMHSYAGV